LLKQCMASSITMDLCMLAAVVLTNVQNAIHSQKFALSRAGHSVKPQDGRHAFFFPALENRIYTKPVTGTGQYILLRLLVVFNIWLGR
jgi:hypothetical protein